MKAITLIFTLSLFLLLGCCKTYDNFKDPGSINQDSHELVVNKIIKIEDYQLPNLINDYGYYSKIRNLMKNGDTLAIRNQRILESILITFDSTRAVPLFDFEHFILIPYNKQISNPKEFQIYFKPYCLINHKLKTVTFEVNTKHQVCSYFFQKGYYKGPYNGWVQIAKPPDGYKLQVKY